MRCGQPSLATIMLDLRRRTMVVLLFAALFGLSGCTELPEQVYQIGTSQPGTAFAALGEALQDTVNHAGNARLAAIATSGSGEKFTQSRGWIQCSWILSGYSPTDKAKIQ